MPPAVASDRWPGTAKDSFAPGGVGTSDEMPKTFRSFHWCERLELGGRKASGGAAERISCMIPRRFR